MHSLLTSYDGRRFMFSLPPPPNSSCPSQYTTILLPYPYNFFFFPALSVVLGVLQHLFQTSNSSSSFQPQASEESAASDSRLFLREKLLANDFWLLLLYFLASKCCCIFSLLQSPGLFFCSQWLFETEFSFTVLSVGFVEALR